MALTTYITGASSGIGRALAVELARAGRAVGLIARRDVELRAAASEVEGIGGRAATAVADVRDAAALRDAVARLEAAIGSPDCVVANAGYGIERNAARLSGDEVEAMMSVNFMGAVRLTEVVLPGMLARGKGHIVAVSSLAGYRGLPRVAAYGASKAAMNVFFESLRMDLRPRGIDVTVVTPGFVRTPLTATNKFKMPFLVEVDVAARIIARGIEKRKRVVAFPWPMAALIRLARLLPGGIYERAVARKQPKSLPPKSGSLSSGER